MNKQNPFSKTVKNTNSLQTILDSVNNTDSINALITTQINNLITTEIAPDELILANLQTNSANVNTANTFSQTQTFSKNLICSDNTTLTNNNLTSKLYVDTAVSSGVSSLLSANNTFTGTTNTFNNIPKLSTAKTIIDYSDDSQLTTRKYVVDKFNGFYSSNNNYSGSNTYSLIPSLTTVKTISDYTDDRQLTTKKYCDDKTSSLLSANNTFSGSNSYSVVPSLQSDLTSSITNDLQLTNKKYVDNKANSILSANNTFSGTNTYNNVLSYATDITANITNDNHLANKKYVDSKTANDIRGLNNTFTGNNTFNNVLTYATDITANITDDKHLANKKYVDSKSADIRGLDNTFTGTNYFNKINILNWGYIDGTAALTNTNISGNTTFVGDLSRTTSFLAGANAFTFKAAPKVDSTVTIDDTDDNSIIAVKNLLKLKELTFNYSQTTRNEYSPGFNQYVLTAPRMSTVGNVNNKEIRVASIDLYFGSTTTAAIGSTTATIKIYASYAQKNAVSTTGGSYSVGSNEIQRNTTFLNSDIQLATNLTANSSPASSPVTAMEGSYIVGLAQNVSNVRDVYCRPIAQTFAVVNTSSGNNNSGIQIGRTKIMYGNVSYAFCPYKFAYVDTNTIRIYFNVPCVQNNPSVDGWIDQYSFSAQILTGGLCNVTIGNMTGCNFKNAQTYYAGNQ